MPDLSLTRNVSSTIPEHQADHYALHKAYNAAVLGPFTITHSNADAGVTLWTPEYGDVITGLWVEFTQGWDNVGAEERIGIGIAGTTNADLALKFILAGTVPSAPTFPRGIGIGIPTFGEVVRILSEAPLIARTTIGGHATGSLNLWVTTLPAAML